MDDVELPELPELEKEIRKDKLNTLVAITVTLVVTFTAICKIDDNNIVLKMQQTKAEELDEWSWYQSLNVREDLNQAHIVDIHSDLVTEADAAKKSQLQAKLADFTAKSKKLSDKKDAMKEKATRQGEHYEMLDANHEKFDRSEAAISIAVSMLALTSLLQKRWMYYAALVPALVGIFEGMLGLLS
jgi:hypothetical protein